MVERNLAKVEVAGPSPVFRSKRLKIKRLAIRDSLVAFLFGSQPARCPATSMAVSGGWRRSETSLRSSLPLRSACGPLPFTWPRAATVSRAASASGNTHTRSCPLSSPKVHPPAPLAPFQLDFVAKGPTAGTHSAVPARFRPQRSNRQHL